MTRALIKVDLNDLPLHRLEVPLDPVYADGWRIDQVEALGMFGQDRREHAGDNVSEFWVS